MIGGGLLGLEVANSLRILGKKVTVIEVLDRLLPRQLDQEGARCLQALIEQKGLSFILKETVTDIGGENKVEQVTLKSGRQIPAEAVIISAGIVGRNLLAEKYRKWL